MGADELDVASGRIGQAGLAKRVVRGCPCGTAHNSPFTIVARQATARRRSPSRPPDDDHLVAGFVQLLDLELLRFR